MHTSSGICLHYQRLLFIVYFYLSMGTIPPGLVQAVKWSSTTGFGCRSYYLKTFYSFSGLTNSQLASSVFGLGTVAVLPFYALMVLAPKSELVLLYLLFV